MCWRNIKRIFEKIPEINIKFLINSVGCQCAVKRFPFLHRNGRWLRFYKTPFGVPNIPWFSLPTQQQRTNSSQRIFQKHIIACVHLISYQKMIHRQRLRAQPVSFVVIATLSAHTHPQTHAITRNAAARTIYYSKYSPTKKELKTNRKPNKKTRKNKNISNMCGVRLVLPLTDIHRPLRQTKQKDSRRFPNGMVNF